MNNRRFLQIHTLHSYTAALLNRDDTGQAKRLIYGDKSRTRISSQCLKRHWRMAENDPNALQNLQGYVDSFRSRELVTEKVISPLREKYPDYVVDALEPIFQKFVYGKKADTSRQTLLLGAPELDWLAVQAQKIAEIANSDAKTVKSVADEWMPDKSFKEILAKLRKDEDISEELAQAFVDLKGKNFVAMSENAALPAGLVAALFGRMVTSDPAANIEVPVYVAHAFTVHAAETEGDYFTAVDDLKRDDDDSGAAHIQETEITSGLFYGYVVIDLPGLISNLGGDRDLASRVVGSLVHLIAEVSPGAKRGSTAPFGRADLMLIEAGDRQPRSLATAFRKAISHDPEKATIALSDEIARFDESYATGETRAHLSLRGKLDGVDHKPLSDLADWAGARVSEVPDA